MKLEIENHNDPYLFRYRPNNENTLDEIRNSYIYFPNRDKLNDPFDTSQSLMDLKDDNEAIDSYFNSIYEAAPQLQRDWLLNKIPRRNKVFYAFFKEGISLFINKYGIACFTVTPVHMMLWANYANNHQGVCIQYNSSADLGFFHGVRSVNYVEKISKVSFDIINNAPAFENVFFTKASLWQGEYEVRLLKEQAGKHSLMPEAIRSMVFGRNTPQPFKNELLDMVKMVHPHIRVYDSILLEANFGLRFVLLN